MYYVENTSNDIFELKFVFIIEDDLFLMSLAYVYPKDFPKTYQWTQMILSYWLVFILFISASLCLIIYPMWSWDYLVSVSSIWSTIHLARSSISAPRSDIPSGRFQWFLRKHHSYIFWYLLQSCVCLWRHQNFLHCLSYLLDIKSILQGRHAICFIADTFI